MRSQGRWSENNTGVEGFGGGHMPAMTRLRCSQQKEQLKEASPRMRQWDVEWEIVVQH